MSKLKFQMPNQISPFGGSPVGRQNPKSKYDLGERTAKFGETTIEFVQTLHDNSVNRPLISQLIRSATSIGANYMEADGAESKKDFQHKIGICRKESKETMHWFRMIAKANPVTKEECRKLWKEAHELALIFPAIMRSKKAIELGILTLI